MIYTEGCIPPELRAAGIKFISGNEKLRFQYQESHTQTQNSKFNSSLLDFIKTIQDEVIVDYYPFEAIKEDCKLLKIANKLKVDLKNCEFHIHSKKAIGLENLVFNKLHIYLRDQAQLQLLNIMAEKIVITEINPELYKETITFENVTFKNLFLGDSKELFLNLVEKKNENQEENHTVYLTILKGTFNATKNETCFNFSPINISLTDFLKRKITILDEIDDNFLTLNISFKEEYVDNKSFHLIFLNDLFHKKSPIFNNNLKQLYIETEYINKDNHILLLPDKEQISLFLNSIIKKQSTDNNIGNLLNIPKKHYKVIKNQILNKNYQDSIYYLEKQLREHRHINLANQYAYLSEYLEHKQSDRFNPISFLWQFFNYGYGVGKSFLAFSIITFFCISIGFLGFYYSYPSNCRSNVNFISSHFINFLTYYIIPLFKDIEPLFRDCNSLALDKSIFLTKGTLGAKLLQIASNVIMGLNLTAIIICIKRKYSRNST